MPAPTVSLPTTGTDPKVATKTGLEGVINTALDTLWDDIQTRSTLTQLVRARNIALDGSGVLGTGVMQGAGTVPAAANANAELTARGVVKSRAFGTGSTATALYRRDQLPARSNGKHVFASTYVYSATGSHWPAVPLIAVPYDAASGGSIVSGTTTVAQGYDQVATNLRRYWGQYTLPSTGSLVALVYGFAGVVSGSAAELGGWTLAIGDAVLGTENVALDDWTGYTTRDSWRDGIDTTTAANAAAVTAKADASTTVRNTIWRNALNNPNFDPDEPASAYSTTPTISTPPTSPIMQEHGILAAMSIGNGGTQAFKEDAVLDAASSGLYVFGSMYVYSEDGTNWPAPRIVPYAGSTALTVINLTSYISLSANARLYYGSGQLQVRTDMTKVRMGSSAFSACAAELGGFTLILHTSTLTINDVMRDDWYPDYTEQYQQAVRGRAVDSLPSGPFEGQTWAFNGDSIVGNYGIPTALGVEIGCTVENIGFGGCTLVDDGAPSGLKVYKRYFSFAKLAEAIAEKVAETDDFSDQETAADDMYAIEGAGNNDYRARVATLQSIDWEALDVMPIAYGTNDFSDGVALGSVTSTDIETVNGALNVGIETILTACPSLVLVLIPPLWRNDAPLAGGSGNGLDDSNFATNSLGLMLADYQAAIIARARHFNLPVMPLHEVYGVNIVNYLTFSADGLHPTTAAGQARYVARAGAWCRAVL